MNIDRYGYRARSFSSKWLEYPIDIGLTIFCPSFRWPFDAIGLAVKKMLKHMGIRSVANYLLTTAIPKFGGLFSRGFTFIRKAIWRATGFWISNAVNGSIKRIMDRFASRLRDPVINNVYICICSFFSAGAFIAGVLDYFTDGRFNNRVVLG